MGISWELVRDADITWELVRDAHFQVLASLLTLSSGSRAACSVT